MTTSTRGERALHGLLTCVLVPLFGGLLLWPVWNAVVPELLGASRAGYWQSVGLVWIGGLLFKTQPSYFQVTGKVDPS